MDSRLTIPHWGLWIMFLSGLIGTFLLAIQLGLDRWF